MSPKNRSKLDKLNHSSRASVSEEEETASKNNQEDIGLLFIITFKKTSFQRFVVLKNFNYILIYRDGRGCVLLSSCTKGC